MVQKHLTDKTQHRATKSSHQPMLDHGPPTDLGETLGRTDMGRKQRITKLYDSLSAQGGWPQDIPIEMLQRHVDNTLQVHHHKKRSAETINQDEIASLERELDYCSMGVRVYERLAEVCKDKNERDLFQSMAGLERKRQLELYDSLAYLRDPEGWAMEHEHCSLDGA